MFVVGIDENGYGPLIGPLVATAAAFEVPDYEPEKMAAALSQGTRVADSKSFLSHSNMEKGEITTLAYLACSDQGAPDNYASLLENLLVPSPVDGPACPKPAREMCFGGIEGLPIFSKPEDVEKAASTLPNLLASHNIRFVGARCVMLCAGNFNILYKAISGKALLDLFLFELLITGMSTVLQSEALYLCGKVSGMKRYSDRFVLLGAGIETKGIEAMIEEPALSEYKIQGIGTVRFVRSGDSIHPPTSLASVIGKYLRELSMSAINGFLKRQFGIEDGISGYRDKKTKEAVARVLPGIEVVGIPRHCLLRDA